MDSSPNVLFWSLFSAFHLPICVIPFLYWHRRYQDPIQMRRPGLLTLGAVICVIYIAFQFLRMLTYHQMHTIPDIILGSLLILILCEVLFVFTLSLYISYDKTCDQLQVFHNQQDDPIAMSKLFKSIRIAKFLLSTRFAVLWIVGQIALRQLTVFLLVKRSTWRSLSGTTVAEFQNGQASAAFQIDLIVSVRSTISIILFMVLLHRLRLVKDAFGTKRMLRQSQYGILVVLTNHALTLAYPHYIIVSRIPAVINVLSIDYILYVCYVTPLRQAFKLRTMFGSLKVMPHEAIDAVDELKAFLLTKKGSDEFEEHLMKEFAVENLLFFKDVYAFRAKCEGARVTEAAMMTAWHIFSTYLSPDAPLEVNLSSDIMKLFRNEVFQIHRKTATLNATTFDEAVEQILQLMLMDSFKRFLETNPPAWIEFKAKVDEHRKHKQVTDLCSHTMNQLQDNAKLFGKHFKSKSKSVLIVNLDK